MSLARTPDMVMGARLCWVLVVAAVACDSNAPPATPGDADLGEDAADAEPLDTRLPDTEPPRVISVVPAEGSEAWLHGAIRFELDERVEVFGLAVTARLAGEEIAATATLDASERALVVTLDPTVRGVGALEIALAGTISDAAGNVLVEPPQLTLTIPAWLRPSIDRGAASGAPSLVVSRTGEVIASWLVGSGDAGRVAISRFAHGAWHALGDLRGASATSSASVALDPDDRPVVAWVEAGQVHVERWEGGAWMSLPSPGPGHATTIASGPGGEIVCALVGGDVRVKRLASDAWQPIGGALALAGSLVGEPALAAGAGGRVAVGWVEHVGGSARVQVHRFATAWTKMAPIPLGAPPPVGVDRVTLALRGTRLAVAYDRWERSYGVYAALADGDTTSAWTRLGSALDVDVPGDAQAPAIALDAAGAPVVAWQEQIEGTWRGVLARWDAGRWHVVGGPSWLVGGPPARATIALHAAEAPVVGWSSGGAIGVALHNGPRRAQRGIESRPSLAGCSFDPANPPARVLSTGCFTLTAPGATRPHPGLVPYDVISELWSDGSKKRRWIGLPGTGSLVATGNGSLDAPAGTMIVKEFAVETTPGDPATRRPVETRFLVHTGATWSGFSYRWRADGSDADLLPDGSETVTWPLDTGGSYTHFYPSRTHCRSCHHTSHGPLLGLRPEQLQRWFDYDGVIADQLGTLSAIGVAPASSVAPLPSPLDPGESIVRRARAYLHGNCTHCHNGSYITTRDMRFSTSLAQSGLCSVIVPGDAGGSRVYQLVTRRPGMPALGTLVVDPVAGDLVGRWIDAMTSCP